MDPREHSRDDQHRKVSGKNTLILVILVIIINMFKLFRFITTKFFYKCNTHLPEIYVFASPSLNLASLKTKNGLELKVEQKYLKAT